MMLLRTHNNLGALLICIICFVLFGVAYVLTKGFAFSYYKKIKSVSFKSKLVFFHLVASLILGIISTNHYLDEIEWFKAKFEKEDLLIPVTMLTMGILFAILIGSFISLFNRNKNNTALED